MEWEFLKLLLLRYVVIWAFIIKPIKFGRIVFWPSWAQKLTFDPPITHI